ncbi:MAG: DUF6261 family protein [Dysgonamonadaceae bacterium]|jgi:hypothetical protein|nr:DUF6261 family protein [Dysgonamonadaceae bacterium]
MIKLKTITVRVMPNAAHYYYMKIIKTELSASPAALKDALGDKLAVFIALFEIEEDLMLWTNQKDLTEQIAVANKRLDNALTGLRTLVRSLEFITLASTSQPANRIYKMLQGYGDVNHKPYDEQSGDVSAILKQLQSGGAFYQDVVSLVQPAPAIQAMISELNLALIAFQALLDQRDATQQSKPEKTFTEIRKEIDFVYNEIVTIIDAGAVMNVSPAFAAFITRMNPEIERINEEFHHAKHDIAHCQPEEIPAQQYTGYPVNPTPKVLYVTSKNGTVRLELGKDYDLRYKDNIEVGNAQCTIRGIGAYKGAKTVSFIIKRV